MLAVTKAAGETIMALAAEAGEQDSGGLRISVDSVHTTEQGAAMAIAVVTRPEAGDEVVTAESGAHVFLEPGVASYLTDRVLDVENPPGGRIRFAVHGKLR